MPSLYDPLKVGAFELPNRVIMAPLTRCRADDGRVPNAMMAEYYRQRASAGMILSEATSVTDMGVGYPDTPGIWSEEQVEGWKLTTDAVHGAGGRIILQLWHVGRVSDPDFLNGRQPVSSSAVAVPGHVRQLRPKRPYPVPRPLELDEIPGVIADYRKGAENAKRAGFDGVELHGANGYLPEQFLKDGVNKRVDQYGGAIENRARFMFEALDACIDVWGADRVGLHLSPANNPSICDSNPAAIYDYVARQADDRKIAFICSREALTEDFITAQIRQKFTGKLIANESFTRESAQVIVESCGVDAVAFGRLFIANPDLPHRLAIGAPLNEPEPETFYSPGPQGYTDYPTLEQVQSDHAAQLRNSAD
jgi:2,4-dienoyl-CoA reductase-like NADH-dependent reductase (Old Yellow Enzyme family)